MALGIVEQVGRTDVGRQRSANEDSLVLQPPFFAVADGMGGARAGEVASAIAAEAFEGASAAGEAAEAQLARILREANRRIYDLAVTDESRRGMGTTLTAAKVHDGEVSLGHVGDSRAYRMRDGELEQITRDHSLVAELERSGQITPEAAEHHPHRGVDIASADQVSHDSAISETSLLGCGPELFVDLPQQIGNVRLAPCANVNPRDSQGHKIRHPLPVGRSKPTERAPCARGPWTPTFASNWKFPGATVPTFSTAANAVDALCYMVRSSTFVWSPGLNKGLQ